eukprot:762426-Hanusia_phi.AAC.3
MVKYNEFEYLKEELMEEEMQSFSRESSSLFSQGTGQEDGDEDFEKLSDAEKVSVSCCGVYNMDMRCMCEVMRGVVACCCVLLGDDELQDAACFLMR